MLSQEDLKRRRGGWGSSEVPTVCGVDSYGDITRLVAKTRTEKAGNEYPDTFKGSAATERGNISEMAGIRWPTMVFKEWRRAKELDKFAVHPTMPFLRSTIDEMYFLPDDNGQPSVGAEVKSANETRSSNWGPWSTDLFKPASKEFIEPCARIQSLVHLACRPWLRKCLVMGLFVADRGERLEWGCYVINRHDSEKEIEAIEKTVAGSWQHYIEEGHDPEIDSATASKDVLTTLFPESRRGILATTEADDKRLCELVKAKHLWMSRRKEATAELDKVDRDLRARMEDYDSASGDGYKIHFRNNKDRTSIDWKGIALSLNPPEDLISTYTKTALGARVLRTYIAK